MTDSTTLTLTDLAELLVSLEKDIEKQLTTIWQGADRKDLLQRISGLIIDSVDRVTEIGKRAQFELDLDEEGHHVAYYVIYEWLDDARDLLVLLRNILFEQHRALVLFREDRISSDALSQFESASIEQAKMAVSDLFKKTTEVIGWPTRLDSSISKWKMEKTPWEVISQQLVVLTEQVTTINEQATLLDQVRGTFAAIRSHFEEAYENYLTYLNSLTEALDQSLKPAADDHKEISATGLIKQLRTFSIKSPTPATANSFIDRLDALADNLPTDRFLIIGTENGLLQQRELDMSNDTSAWLQSELMSEVQDFYNRREQINNRLLLAIRTGGNRLEFDRQEGQSLAGKEILYTVEQLIKNIRRAADGIKSLEEKTMRVLNTELNTANAFDPYFLQLNMQQTLDQYRKYQQSGLTELKNWITTNGRDLINKGRDSLKNEGLSASEKIVKLINERKLDAANIHYTGMFVNFGYLGESFRVGREKEIVRVEEIVKNWKSGFRGSVLVTGTRHSGKSFFGELIGHKFFNKRYIDLRPNTRLILGGRTLEPTEDLEEALKFVVANSRGQKTMVLIDDLADWQDKETPLAGDVKSLMSNLDRYAGQLFFVVVADKVLYDQLRIHFDIDRYFQVTFPMSRLSLEEISEAIYIRHGATQMQIVDATGKELMPEQIQQQIKPIALRAYGHIGEALREWAYAVRPFDEDSVRLVKPNTGRLNVNFTKDAGILLRSILIDRSTTEYQLRKQFGPLFKSEFEPLIQRYLQLGILTRRPNGVLEVLPAIVGDLERELQRQAFIPGKNTTMLEKI